jgi:hypothetical protein
LQALQHPLSLLQLFPCNTPFILLTAGFVTPTLDSTHGRTCKPPLQDHLCKDFLEGKCPRAACPNAHGFAEIRGAMNDSSPICWKWLEGRCRVQQCKYAHTFRRHHKRSMDSRRGSVSGCRASMDSTSGRRSFMQPCPVAPNRNDKVCGSSGNTPTSVSSGRGYMPRKSLDASGMRRASFGHSRASIDGADQDAWKANVSELHSSAVGSFGGAAVARSSLEIAPPQTGGLPANGVRNYAMEGAFTRQAKVPSQLQHVQRGSQPPPRSHGNGEEATAPAPLVSSRESMELARACIEAAYKDPGAVARSSGSAPWRPASLSSGATTGGRAEAGRSNVSKW